MKIFTIGFTKKSAEEFFTLWKKSQKTKKLHHKIPETKIAVSLKARNTNLLQRILTLYSFGF
jgi:hypothetical protein